MDELAKLVRGRNEVKQTIAHSGRQVESRMEDISTIEGKMSNTTTKMQALTTELQQKEAEAAQVEGLFTAQRERANQWQTKIESDEETLETVVKTIKDTGERLSYHSDKLKAASKALKEKEDLLDVRKKALAAAEKDLATVTQEFEAAKGKADKLNQEYTAKK